jgi:hypothetical protein
MPMFMLIYNSDEYNSDGYVDRQPHRPKVKKIRWYENSDSYDRNGSCGGFKQNPGFRIIL